MLYPDSRLPFYFLVGRHPFPAAPRSVPVPRDATLFSRACLCLCDPNPLSPPWQRMIKGSWPLTPGSPHPVWWLPLTPQWGCEARLWFWNSLYTPFSADGDKCDDSASYSVCETRSLWGSEGRRLLLIALPAPGPSSVHTLDIHCLLHTFTIWIRHPRLPPPPNYKLLSTHKLKIKSFPLFTHLW